MKVKSEAMNGGIIPDRYGKRGNDTNEYGVPNRSIPFEIEEFPEETVSFAIVMEDKDAVPVCGFSWIHWVVANIQKTSIEENDSINATDYQQGINSWFGTYGKAGSLGYGGMTPPNAPHIYELHVYALDTTLDLENGFFLNELYRAMDGHILDTATIKGTYNN